MLTGRRNILLFTGVLTLLVLFFMVDIFLGSVTIAPADVWAALTGVQVDTAKNYILLHFRLPKALTALLTGIGLSLAGLQMQTLFRNPLAGPFVLGISSGASLGVALFVMATSAIAGSFTAFFLGSWGIVVFAITGALLVLFMVIAVSVRVTDSVSLLIIGIMFGSIAGAVVSVLQYFSDPVTVHSFLVWTFGSLSGVTWDKMWIMALLVLLGAGITFSMQKSLNALLLGENNAYSLGVDVKRVRLWIILSTSLMAGTITAFAGPIAFIGVAVPHITRMLFNTSDHKITITASCFIGALIMLVCDVIAQLPGYSNTLPINSVTALFGAPVVIWVIVKNRNVKASF